jgi:hypothetical protein
MNAGKAPPALTAPIREPRIPEAGVGLLRRSDVQCAEPGAPEIASCNTLGGKHQAESGHVHSAVDIAAKPLQRLPSTWLLPRATGSKEPPAFMAAEAAVLPRCRDRGGRPGLAEFRQSRVARSDVG